jgi:carboxypeptidase PM20D1
MYAKITSDLFIQGVLEATEFLLKSGHKPQRTFYIAFGHDEEVNFGY